MIEEDIKITLKSCFCLTNNLGMHEFMQLPAHFRKQIRCLLPAHLQGAIPAFDLFI